MLYFHAALRLENRRRADRIEDVGLGNADTEKGAREVRGIVKRLRDG
jgi:hypothetical protein